jgi:membrane protease YdiL (CAAX protease family)
MKKICIPILVVLACVVMGIVDAVIQPGYAVKSAIKLVLFLAIPVAWAILSKENSIKSVIKPTRKGFFISCILGALVYVVIVGAYLIFKDVFDFSALVGSLNETTGVNKSNFIFVAIYISFVNSFLEEFFFRGYAFLTMKKFFTKKTAYIFSSLAFALYHIAMMIGWFGLPVVLISLLGLFAGGMIFNKFDEKNGNIYLSWLIHMFANFATNTIGFMLFAV